MLSPSKCISGIIEILKDKYSTSKQSGDGYFRLINDNFTYSTFPSGPNLEKLLNPDFTERPMRVINISLNGINEANSFFPSLVTSLWKFSSLHIYVIVTNMTPPQRISSNALENITLFASSSYASSLNPLLNLDIRLSQNSFSGQESFFDQYSLFNPAIYMCLMTLIVFSIILFAALSFILGIKSPARFGSIDRKKNQ